MTFKPSAHQQAYFDWVKSGEGNAIVEAVAGSGKTTAIVHGLEYMDGHVFLGAYNSKMAKELKDRTAGRQGVFSSTFHAAGFKALKFAFKNEALNINEKKTATLIEEYIMRTNRFDLRELADCVTDVVSMAKQRGIGALLPMNEEQGWLDMIDHFALDENLPEHAIDRMDQVVKFAQVILRDGNNRLDVIDFDDMVYLPLQRGLRMLQNDWVLIDEAQDTNPTRRALAKKMLRPGGRLVAVGDPHQAIFGFTGADNDSLELIARDFNCTRLPLTVTYRCPKAVVRHAQQWVNHIEAASTAKEGEVIDIKYDELEKHVLPGDAILCRYNKYLVNLCFKLIRDGRPARIEGRQIGAGLVALAAKWKVKNLSTLTNKVTNYMEREVTKAKIKGNDQKADMITDRCETLLVLIERAVEQKIDDVAGLKKMVEDLFDDRVVDNKSMITLCSMHRSKGMEWDRVFLLGRSELQPAAFCKKDWQLKQEYNLIYVGVTRAMKTLYEVTGVREEKKQHGEAA